MEWKNVGWSGFNWEESRFHQYSSYHVTATKISVYTKHGKGDFSALHNYLSVTFAYNIQVNFVSRLSHKKVVLYHDTYVEAQASLRVRAA